jgi:chromosome partitioning protein
MKPPVLTFFNNKGGVGKTSLVYHLAWMYSEKNKTVLAVDLDPQANLTAAFLEEEALEEIWGNEEPSTIFQAVKPLTDVGDLQTPSLCEINNHLFLLPGDVALSSFEELLSQEWPNTLSDQNPKRSFRIVSSFWRIMQNCAQEIDADLILVDVGPNLGAINRSVLIATDYVVIPLSVDLFSVQGLKNLGPSLRSWRNQWQRRVDNWPQPDLELPEGKMKPVGYICQQPGIRLDRPVKAYNRWANRIPDVYRESILDAPHENLKPADDPFCLSVIKHYRSLVPMAQEARKPIFHLTSADGAFGSHATAAHEAYEDFSKLADTIWQAIQSN